MTSVIASFFVIDRKSLTMRLNLPPSILPPSVNQQYHCLLDLPTEPPQVYCNQNDVVLPPMSCINSYYFPCISITYHNFWSNYLSNCLIYWSISCLLVSIGHCSDSTFSSNITSTAYNVIKKSALELTHFRWLEGYHYHLCSSSAFHFHL